MRARRVETKGRPELDIGAGIRTCVCTASAVLGRALATLGNVVLAVPLVRFDFRQINEGKDCDGKLSILRRSGVSSGAAS